MAEVRQRTVLTKRAYKEVAHHRIVGAFLHSVVASDVRGSNQELKIAAYHDAEHDLLAPGSSWDTGDLAGKAFPLADERLRDMDGFAKEVGPVEKSDANQPFECDSQSSFVAEADLAAGTHHLAVSLSSWECEGGYRTKTWRLALEATAPTRLRRRGKLQSESLLLDGWVVAVVISVINVFVAI